LAETETNPLRRPLPDGIVPEDEVTRTEGRWIAIVLGMLGVMMAVIVVTGVTNALHPPSNVETIDPTTLHLGANSPKAILARRWSPTVLPPFA
jgi:cytochrome c oxidase subunit II